MLFFLSDSKGLLLRLNTFCCYIFLLVWLIQPSQIRASTDAIKSQPASFNFSYETLTLPHDENMGLLGAGYYWTVPEGFQIGVAAFGALTGKRGGFFTGGVDASKTFSLAPRVDLRAGFFVGGGGGGSAPQGGGLMLRPHVDFTYLFHPAYRAGFGLSTVRFPNGDIDSTQASLVFDGMFDLYLKQGAKPSPDFKSPDRLALFVRSIALDVQNYYSPDGGVINLMGVKMRQSMWRHGFFSLTTHGAYGGGVDGYAEIFAGSGLRAVMNRVFDVSAELALGAGGGGAVNTGGGGLIAGQLTVHYILAPSWLVYLSGGQVYSIDGAFHANTAGLGVSYRYMALSPGGTQPLISGTRLSSHDWRVRSGITRYLPDKGTQRKSGKVDTRPIDLIGVAADLWQNEHVYLSGQAYSAIDADAGGYSKGLIGVGVQSHRDVDKVSVGAELAAGAAGGGGIDVGSGVAIQSTVFLDIPVNDVLRTTLFAGQLTSPLGSFTAGLIGMQLSYEFSSVYQIAGF